MHLEVPNMNLGQDITNILFDACEFPNSIHESIRLL
jgi:hypothetical protein